MILPRIGLISAAKASENACQNRAVMAAWTSIAAFWLKKLILRQQTEVSAETIRLLLSMNK